MAEFAFDVVNPDYHRQRSQADILQSFAQPADFREGVTLAMNAFRRVSASFRLFFLLPSFDWGGKCSGFVSYCDEIRICFAGFC